MFRGSSDEATPLLPRLLAGAGVFILALSTTGYIVAWLYQASMRGGGPRGAAVSRDGKTGPAHVGWLEIPRLGLSAAIREGVDAPSLLVAVGHLPGTALPGERGNVVLSAHRDTFFRPLRRVRRGDRVTIQTSTGSYQYRIESTTIVRPNRVDLLAPTREATLTLITCYPFDYIGPAPGRFVARATQVSPAPESAGARSGSNQPAAGA